MVSTTPQLVSELTSGTKQQPCCEWDVRSTSLLVEDYESPSEIDEQSRKVSRRSTIYNEVVWNMLGVNVKLFFRENDQEKRAHKRFVVVQVTTNQSM